MKKFQKNQKINPKKTSDIHNTNNPNKKTSSIVDNNNTLLNFFNVSSVHKSTVINKESLPARQDVNDVNKDKNGTKKNYRLSKYKFYESKITKNSEINKKIEINNDENTNKIDISNFILFTENFSEQINDIFTNNFIRNFKRYLEFNFQNDKKSIGPRQDLNISKNSFNKFIQQIFKHFIKKYLLSQYGDLIYVSSKYMIEKNIKNDFSEIELLSYNDKANIYLEYSPINLTESNLFYPQLTSLIVKYIKKFRQKKRKKLENKALLIYRPNSDFTSFVNKIRLICNQIGYNLLVKEDETNKLMNFEKVKVINQNYIIGSLKDKNKKYLQIINNFSFSEKWKNFLKSNNLSNIEKEEAINSKTQKNNRNKNLSKTQSTQAFSKKILQNKDNLSQSILTFIGHNNSNEMGDAENSKKKSSKEYKISKNYQQNVLQKFNKRKNVILFLDNFDENEENIKYINQINSIIPDSKSPLIILTNNLSLFTNNLNNGNNSTLIKYIPEQIENEGIFQKENVIFMTFLIIYFIAFFPKAEIKKQELNKDNDINDKNNNINQKNDNNDNNTEIEKDIDNELDFVIHIKDDESDDEDSQENKNYDCNLDRIKKVINDIFIDIDLNTYQNKLYSSLISLSYIISIINQYELDNILVYLKNLFQLIDPQLNNIHVKPNTINTLSLLKKEILKDIEEYQLDEKEINDNEEDISKISEIYENDSFYDYEYGKIHKIGEKQFGENVKNYGINTGINYNKESYFFINKFCDNKKYMKKFNHISNKEIEERIIEDHKFFHSYYNTSNAILNYSDIAKLNMILVQIIFNERINLEDTSRFIGVRFSRRSKSKNNNNMINEKITILNKIFRKCPIELFTKYINAHFGIKYYVEFIIDNKKYNIPEKLLFYNYYNDYYLIEKIQSELQSRYSGIEEDEDDDNDFGFDDDSEMNEEDEDIY